MRLPRTWPACLALLLLLCSLPAVTAQDAPPVPAKIYAMMQPWPGAGTMVMAFATGCDACTHVYFDLDVLTPTGHERLRRLVPKAPDGAPTWVYWMVEGEPPAVRVRRAIAANVMSVTQEGFGEE